MNHGDLSDKKELAEGLRELQRRIAAAKVTSSKLDESINLATFNIRDFGKSARWEESLHLLAEIIGQFDLVSLIEVRKDLSQLAEVLRILGPYWRAIYSDYLKDRGGNDERIALVYDKRAVTFNGFVANAAPKRVSSNGQYLPRESWLREPFMASFKAGSFDFVVLCVHIRWSGKKEERVRELQMLADWVDEHIKDSAWTDRDVIVMGDLNITKIESDFYRAVSSKGLLMPEAIATVNFTNVKKDSRYDQILICPQCEKGFINKGGVLDFHAGDWKKLFPGKPVSSDDKYTYQLSDHFPLWVQLNTNIEGFKLDQIIQSGK